MGLLLDGEATRLVEDLPPKRRPASIDDESMGYDTPKPFFFVQRKMVEPERCRGFAR
jgi:hypothetical protein